jgi:hypothetical protein
MEKIKVRAWDKFNACYYYSEKYKSFSKFFEGCEMCEDAGNRMTYQLGVNYKCLNKDDIYKGDIFQSVDKEVIFVLDYGYNTMDNSYGWKLVNPKTQKSYPLDRSVMNMNCIGNTFENPEKLKF